MVRIFVTEEAFEAIKATSLAAFRFCAEYNKISFDPANENEPLATFEPMATPRAREALVLPSRNLALTRAR